LDKLRKKWGKKFLDVKFFVKKSTFNPR